MGEVKLRKAENHMLFSHCKYQSSETPAGDGLGGRERARDSLDLTLDQLVLINGMFLVSELRLLVI